MLLNLGPLNIVVRFELLKVDAHFLVDVEFEFVENLVPLLKLVADLVFDLLLLSQLEVVESVQLVHLVEDLRLLAQLLGHLYEDLCPHADLSLSLVLLPDVMAFVSAEKRTCVTALLPAPHADQFPWLSVLKTHHNTSLVLSLQRDWLGQSLS